RRSGREPLRGCETGDAAQVPLGELLEQRNALEHADPLLAHLVGRALARPECRLGDDARADPGLAHAATLTLHSAEQASRGRLERPHDLSLRQADGAPQLAVRLEARQDRQRRQRTTVADSERGEQAAKLTLPVAPLALDE